MHDPRVRVIAGSARGRRLKTPKGTSTRPTSDKVRGAIFSILLSQRDLADTSVLDLFAGTGALGIEALSRGATRAVFVEKDPRVAALVTENLLLTRFDSISKVIRADADKLELASLGTFDLVFADPPYALVLTSRALSRIGDVLTENGVAIVEHGIDAPPPDPTGLVAFDRREYGDTGITFFKRGP